MLEININFYGLILILYTYKKNCFLISNRIDTSTHFFKLTCALTLSPGRFEHTIHVK